MTRRTANIVVSFLDIGDAPIPMAGDYNVSTHGYRSPDAPYRYAPARLKGSISIDKSIGCVMWGERSGVEFGNVDIAIEDGGRDLSAGAMIDWIEWAKNNPNPLVVISVELTDGTLEHVATAEARDVFWPDDLTIRISIEALHAAALAQFINTYYSGVSSVLDGLPIPIYWGAGSFQSDLTPPFQVSVIVNVTQRDAATLRYDVTDLPLIELSPTPYTMLHRGIQLDEGMSPGFNVVDNGVEMTSNDEGGKLTFAMAANQGGGVEDPFETGEVLQGPWRIIRLMLDRVDIDWATYYPDEAAFDDLDLGTQGHAFPIVSYTAEVSAHDAIQRIMDSVGGWYYPDEMGNFRFGRVERPGDMVPAAEYSDTDTLGAIRVTMDRAPGLSTRAHGGWRPGFYDEDGIAGGVDDFYRNRISKEWQARETNEAIPAIYATAAGVEPMEIYTTQANPLQDELDRRWELYDGTRRFYDFTIPQQGGVYIPELGEAVLLRSDKFRMLNNPVALYVSRIRWELGANRVQVRGWGGDPAAIPSAPINAIATTVSDEAIDVDWTDTSGDEDGFLVFRSLNGTTGWTEVADVAADTTTWQDTGLDPSTTYYYRVNAYNAQGISAPSNVASATTHADSFSPDNIADLVSWLDAAETAYMFQSDDSPITPTDGETFDYWDEGLCSSPGAVYWGSRSDVEHFRWLQDVDGHNAVTLSTSASAGARNGADVDTRPVTQSEQTVFIVCSLAATNNFLWTVSTMSALSGPSGGGYGVIFDRRSTNDRAGIAVTTTNSQTYADLTATDTSGDRRCIAVRGTGQSGDIDTWRDGVHQNTAPLSVSFDYWNTGGGAYLCANFGGAGPVNTFYLNEMLIYNRALTDMEVDLVNDYLVTKYGL